MPDAAARTLTLAIPAPAAMVRGILLAFVFLLPILFDSTVPEVSGDIRWTFTHIAAGLVTLVGLWALWDRQGKSLKVDFHWPLMLWWALGLAIWAAVSMVDALAPMRGIVLIKAMYAQLLLLAAAYLCWKPGFTRKLVWALAIMLPFMAWVGTCQFMGWNDATFKVLMLNTPGMGWLGAVWPDGTGGWGIINPLITLYLQSAVPGSTFANKNLAGSYTVMMLPLAGYLIVSSRAWWGRAVASLCLATGTLFLVYSRSRASWVALTFGLLALAIALMVSKPWRDAVLGRAHWKVLALCLVPTVLLVGMFGSAVSPVKGAYAVDRTPAQQVEALKNSSWDEIGGRFAYNLNSFAIIRDHWFNGVGVGSFFGIYPAYHNAFVSTPTNSYSVMARPQRTHTDLMQAFDEMGIPGGSFYMLLVLSSLAYAWRMRGAEAVRKAGLFPLFGGLSLLVISINSLMDFPMQLPTAPAVACILMGTMAAHYKAVFPGSGWSPRRWIGNFRLPVPPLAVPLLFAAWAGVFGWAVWDDYWFRVGNQILKAGMMRIYSGINDDETLRLVNYAQSTYPWDPRIHEHVAVAYANYKGNREMPIEERIGVLEWILNEDPWGPNHLVNAAGQYLQLAENTLNAGNMAVAQRAEARTEEIYGRLQRVAGFSHFTWGVGGMLALLRGQNEQAKALFERALTIDPNYPPAISGLQIANMRIGVAQAVSASRAPGGAPAK